MARYIDADKLIAHLVDEKERCPNDEIEYPISYGCRLGLQGAISFAETQPTADVAPKSEVAREILSDLKKKIHDRAVYTGSRDIPNYIDLKTLDAIIDKIAKEAG